MRVAGGSDSELCKAFIDTAYASEKLQVLNGSHQNGQRGLPALLGTEGMLISRGPGYWLCLKVTPKSMESSLLHLQLLLKSPSFVEIHVSTGSNGGACCSNEYRTV